MGFDEKLTADERKKAFLTAYISDYDHKVDSSAWFDGCKRLSASLFLGLHPNIKEYKANPTLTRLGCRCLRNTQSSDNRQKKIPPTCILYVCLLEEETLKRLVPRQCKNEYKTIRTSF